MDGSALSATPKHEIRLADYEPPAFFVRSVSLDFIIAEEGVLVTATTQIMRNGTSKAELHLDGSPYMELDTIAINGKPLEISAYEFKNDKLIIPSVSDRFELQIKTKLKPIENKRLEGLYASGGNLSTQCEAEGFRHITYFPDRPDVLAQYTVRIEAEKRQYPVLLSNGDLKESGDLEAGRHYAVWEDPHPKPSYLFALVAGKLSAFSDHFRTKSGRNVALNIYVREADLDKCAHAMLALKNSMKWDEDVFDLEYDLDIYNIVAVSDFNMGAMENKGLNIFNTKYVLANDATATDTDFANIEGVIGHEYFHNWTGNRVTCRDWFQLSLKEGLTVFRDQEFSSDMGSRAVKRIDDVRLLRLLQFPEDAGPLSHPIRPESYFEINNFYTATVYNKGAEVIRMMQTLLSRDVFICGVQFYLSKHDGQAATCEDFVQAMEHVSGEDLSQFRRWYSQAGTPQLSITRKFVDNAVILTVKQTCDATPGQPVKEPFYLPLVVGWIDKDGKEIRPAVNGDGNWGDGGCHLKVKSIEQTYRFSEVEKGCVPSLLRGFSAPVSVKTDLTNEEHAFLLAYDTDSFARWQAGQDLYTSYLLMKVDADLKNSDVTVYQRLSTAFLKILEQENSDPAFKAELLTLPSEIYLGQLQTKLEPDALHNVREELMLSLASEHSALLLSQFQDSEIKAHGNSREAKATRKLRNVLLGYLVYTNSYNPVIKELLFNQYYRARNMTEQLWALTLVSHSNFPERTSILDHFYNEWQHDELVVDKWFAVQAQSKRADTLETVKQLLEHVAFSIENPNRLRSLISTFSMLNQVRFHDENGAGYQLLAKIIAHVDKVNPQTAARMVAPLGRWDRLDERRQALMLSSLTSLADQSKLSDDVRELITKSLQTQ